MLRKLLERPTGEILVLMITSTICGFIVVMGSGLLLIEIFNPDADTKGAASVVNDVLSTMIGLLAGFLAGRTDKAIQNGRKDKL